MIAHPVYLTDMDAAVSFARQKYPARHVIVYGRSLGGSLALVLGSMRADIAGIVAECPYASQASLIKNVKATSTKASDARITSIPSSQLEPYQHVAPYRTPNVLVLHGMKEKFITSSELQALVSALQAPNKRFLDVPECDHLEIPTKEPQRLGDALAKFFTDCI